MFFDQPVRCSLLYCAGLDKTPGPGQYDTIKVSYGAISNQPTPRATAVVGKERYEWKSFAPPVTKYAVPGTFGTGSPDKAGGKSWTIGVSVTKVHNNINSINPESAPDLLQFLFLKSEKYNVPQSPSGPFDRRFMVS